MNRRSQEEVELLSLTGNYTLKLPHSHIICPLEHDRLVMFRSSLFTILDHEHSSIRAHTLMQAFVWKATPQGENFWRNISSNLEFGTTDLYPEWKTAEVQLLIWIYKIDNILSQPSSLNSLSLGECLPIWKPNKGTWLD